MPPSPVARNRGVGPTGMVATTFSVLASTRVRRLFFVLVIQTEPASKAAVNEPGEMTIFETTLFVAGSIRERTPAASEGIQILPAPAVIPPSVFATPDVIEATIFWDFKSTRATDPSLQIGAQTLPKAIVNPEQGFFATSITAPTLLVPGSNSEMLFFGLFEIQTLSPIATQSGDPGMENLAIACRSDIGCWTDFKSGPAA